jgi:hypothetical protein
VQTLNVFELFSQKLLPGKLNSKFKKSVWYSLWFKLSARFYNNYISNVDNDNSVNNKKMLMFKRDM